MADIHVESGAQIVHPAEPGAMSVLFNWTGALLSVALIGGLTVWGYQLAMRDVSGVPVIRALEGPMRIQPDDPGGAQAAHQGLAVNSVAADGTAEAPADRLVLAPAPIDLNDDDLPRPSLAGSPDGTRLPVARPSEAEIASLADELADGVVPLSAAIKPGTPAAAGAAAIPASVAGVSRSPFPKPRPSGDLAAEAVATSVALAGAAPAEEIDPGAIPAGTRLVQFGAFDSPEAARDEWAKLDTRFGDFLREKKRVVQEAVSGGKTFWRLRAMGFADINDARRFCSVLLAERQACIPVVTR